MEEKKRNIYYDYHDLLSRGALLNFVIGERGVGKTYGAIKWCVQRYLKTGEEFVYLRRYKSELKESVPKFFEAINANDEFPEQLLCSKNNKFYDGKHCMGYALPLSTSNILKGTSFAKVTTIIFDEFLIDKGCYHYLQNEVTQFLDLVETVSRLRDVRVILLGNAISTGNPYFDYFNLALPYSSTFKSYKQGLICVNYIKNEAYREEKRASRFGKLIADTPYGKYAIDNEMLRDNKNFIAPKGTNAKIYCNIVVKNTTYGIWKDSEGIYVSTDYDPCIKNLYATNYDDHKEGTTYAGDNASLWLNLCRSAYKMGLLYFDNMRVKNDLLPFLEH